VTNQATRDAVTRLLTEHAGSLARVAAGYCRRRADEEDLLQDVAVALLRAWPTFRHACSERTFVLRIAHNRGIEASLRRRAEAERLTDDAGEDRPTGRPDAEAALGAAQQRAALFAAIHTLPLATRTVVLLALEDASQAEIAEVLGTSENAVAIRLTRARAALREALARGRRSES
jgi:RNA polymerase sigma factor (sigma-70 family)